MTSEWADAVERDDSMDDVNYHTREVYAIFGLTTCCAQVLEHDVVNLVLAKIFPDPAATREMFAPVMEQHFAQVSAAGEGSHSPLGGATPNCRVHLFSRRSEGAH